MEKKNHWLALAIGNSRLHWAWFKELALVETWNTKHLPNAVRPHQLPDLYLSGNLLEQNLSEISVYLASVVSEQTKLWQSYRKSSPISLNQIELSNIYPTMGVDRALAAWGAIAVYERPCLVIDGGTALTFTGVNEQRQFVGGAILPGLRSQSIALQQKTAALPEVQLPTTLPTRWASNTDEAIASGIIYTTISGIRGYIVDWLQQFSTGRVIFTGGDAELLAKYLHFQFPELIESTIIDPNLIFWGVRLVYQQEREIRSI